MSRLYATAAGDEGTKLVSRRGFHEVAAHARGWDVGGKVHVFTRGGEDVVRLYRTSGSNGNEPDVLIAEFAEPHGIKREDS